MKDIQSQENYLNLNGSAAFSSTGVSLPTPTQEISSEVGSVEYRFNQKQFGYLIALDNAELLHEKQSSTRKLGSEKTIRVILSSNNATQTIVPETGIAQETQGRVDVNPLLNTIDNITRSIVQNGVIVGITLLAGVSILYLIRNKRRTGKYLPEFTILER